IKSFDYSTGQTLATNVFGFDSSKYYSVFTLGTASAYQNVVTRDNFDSLSTTAGMAYVRYINAVNDPNPVAVSFMSNGTEFIKTNAPFASVSGFMAAAPGDVNITITNDGSVNSNRKITVEQNKLYTILLTGIPGSTDSDKAVQIKFIQNGSL
ncbi:MAG: DUF4397 domain-containing protein, partial [Chitinophagaceae bacterium]